MLKILPLLLSCLIGFELTELHAAADSVPPMHPTYQIARKLYAQATTNPDNLSARDIELLSKAAILMTTGVNISGFPSDSGTSAFEIAQEALRTENIRRAFMMSLHERLTTMTAIAAYAAYQPDRLMGFLTKLPQDDTMRLHRVFLKEAWTYHFKDNIAPAMKQSLLYLNRLTFDDASLRGKEDLQSIFLNGTPFKTLDEFFAAAKNGSILKMLPEEKEVGAATPSPAKPAKTSRKKTDKAAPVEHKGALAKAPSAKLYPLAQMEALPAILKQFLRHEQIPTQKFKPLQNVYCLFELDEVCWNRTLEIDGKTLRFLPSLPLRKSHQKIARNNGIVLTDQDSKLLLGTEGSFELLDPKLPELFAHLRHQGALVAVCSRYPLPKSARQALELLKITAITSYNSARELSSFNFTVAGTMKEQEMKKHVDASQDKHFTGILVGALIAQSHFTFYGRSTMADGAFKMGPQEGAVSFEPGFLTAALEKMPNLKVMGVHYKHLRNLLKQPANLTRLQLEYYLFKEQISGAEFDAGVIPARLKAAA